MNCFANPLENNPRLVASNTPAVDSGPVVRIAPNRLMIDDRFPSLSFIIQTGPLPYFEVLLTIDRALFDPTQDSRRNANSFYSSRQDSGLIDASIGQDTYLVPQAVLQTFASQQPKPTRIYYTAIAYADDQGNAPQFSHPPQSLPQTAPSVELSPDFTGTTIARLLGMSLSDLQTIGSDGRPIQKNHAPQVGGLPVYPPPGNNNGALDPENINGNQTIQPNSGYIGPVNGIEAEETVTGTPNENPGLRVDSNGIESANESDTRTVTEKQAPAPNVASPIETVPDEDFHYDDGFGDLPDSTTAQRSSLGSAAIGGYGDDDFGIPPEPNGKSDDEAGGTHLGPNGNGNGNQTTNYRNNLNTQGNGAVQHELESDIPALDNIGGVQSQSLQRHAARSFEDQQPPGEVQTSTSSGDGTVTDNVEEKRQLFESGTRNSNGNLPAGAGLDGPTGTDSTASNAPGELSVERKRHIIERVGQHRQPPVRYDALSLDGAFRGRFGKEHPYYQRAHDGLSYGIAQFNQDSGQLGILLDTMQQRDSARFGQVFGPSANALVQMNLAAGPISLQSPNGRSARVQPLDGKDIWEEPWAGRFRDAAQITSFQGAQNQIAAELFLNPMIDLARWFGINSERGLALLYDRAISQQPESATAFLSAALSDLNTDVLRNQALDFIKSRNPAIQSLGDFQNSIPGIERSDEWDSYTIAALHGALRQFGADSPIALKDYSESLTAIAQSATAQAFAGQVQRILSDDQLGDERFG